MTANRPRAAPWIVTAATLSGGDMCHFETFSLLNLPVAKYCAISFTFP